MNPKKTYAIKDSKGKIIEPFRTKQAATIRKPIIEKNLLYEKVEIVRIGKTKGLNIRAL